MTQKYDDFNDWFERLKELASEFSFPVESVSKDAWLFYFEEGYKPSSALEEEDISINATEMDDDEYIYDCDCEDDYADYLKDF